MFDYFTDEEDIEELMKEDSQYVKKKYESYMRTGEKLHLLDEDNKKHYTEWFQEIIKGNESKNTIEMNNDM